MKGKFGSNNWKIKLVSIFQKILFLLFLIIVLAGIYKFTLSDKIKPEEEKLVLKDSGDLEVQSTTEPVQEPALEPTKEPTPTTAPTATPVPGVSMGVISNVSATSSLSEYGMTHSPDRLLDNDLTTAWVEGVSGHGEGESVRFSFNGVYRVSGFTIYAGYQKNSDIYSKNARPSQIELIFSDGQTEMFQLADLQDKQTFNLENPVDTSTIDLKLVSVYSGWKYTDTAISEILFY